MANGKIILSSLEESQGKQLCRIVIEINKVDIEIYDL